MGVRELTSRPDAMAVIADRLREGAALLDVGDIAAARSLIEGVRGALVTAAPSPSSELRLVGGVTLTDREAATLSFLPDGSMSQKDIASELEVSRNTVKTHVKSLYRKLGVHGRGEAIQRARELGLLDAAPPSRQSGAARRWAHGLTDRTTA